MKDKKINVITFGKPDGNKKINIGHLSGGILYADLQKKFYNQMNPNNKSILISGVDGYGMSTYISCWEHYGRVPQKHEIEDYVKGFYENQMKTLSKYRVDIDFYGNDSNPTVAAQIQSLCDFVLEWLIKTGLCSLKEEYEFIDSVYDVAVGNRNIYKDNEGNCISKISKKPILKRKRKNWFLNLEMAKPIILESLSLYNDRQVKKYVERMLFAQLEDFRITNYQPWALPVGLENHKIDGMKYYVWFVSLLEPLLYTMTHKNCTIDKIQTDFHFEQFIAEDNIFFYTIIRPILWKAVGCSDVDLIYFKFRSFLDDYGNKFITTADEISRTYDIDHIRFFFLLRGQNYTVYNFSDDDYGKSSKVLERALNMCNYFKNNSITKAVESVTSNEFYKKISDCVIAHEFRKAADLIEKYVMKEKTDSTFWEVCPAIISNYI